MADELKKLVLHEVHEELGARFAPFVGYEMPLQYSGIVDEHKAVRSSVGIFDVSHMGDFFVEGPDAIVAIDRIVTNSIADLPNGKAAYTVMCVEDGGIVDDLIVYRLADDRLFIVVNASRRADDLAHMRAHLKGRATLVDRSDEFSLLAVQGPDAEKTLDDIVEADLTELAGFHAVSTASGEAELLIGRTGYTGEDGFEVLVPNEHAEAIYHALLNAGDEYGIQPCGLGARDTLRLEVKYPLYGNDITLDTNPLEAGLGWVVKLRKETPFVGQKALQAIRKEGVTRRLRAVRMTGRGVLRAGYPLYLGDEKVGELTSGSMSPTLGYAVGMGYVDIEHANATEGVEVEIRGRRADVDLSKKAFYQRQ